MPSNYLYIAVMALVSYTIRILPLTLIRKPIRNRFIQSFLYYVPYATLAVMTFPAIIHATQTPISGAAALAAGIAAAWMGAGTPTVRRGVARTASTSTRSGRSAFPRFGDLLCAGAFDRAVRIRALPPRSCRRSARSQV